MNFENKEESLLRLILCRGMTKRKISANSQKLSALF